MYRVHFVQQLITENREILIIYSNINTRMSPREVVAPAQGESISLQGGKKSFASKVRAKIRAGVNRQHTCVNRDKLSVIRAHRYVRDKNCSVISISLWYYLRSSLSRALSNCLLSNEAELDLLSVVHLPPRGFRYRLQSERFVVDSPSLGDRH